EQPIVVRVAWERVASRRGANLLRPFFRRVRWLLAQRRIFPSPIEPAAFGGTPDENFRARTELLGMSKMVESRCGAVAVGRTYLFPPLSSGGALVVWPCLRFHIPLIEPDRRLSRIRLSDKTSRLRPRHVAPKRGQAYEPEVPVKVRKWIGPALAAPDFVLDTQPPAQPHSGVVVDRTIRFGDGAYLEVVRPSTQRAIQLGHQ